MFVRRLGVCALCMSNNIYISCSTKQNPRLRNPDKGFSGRTRVRICVLARCDERAFGRCRGGRGPFAPPSGPDAAPFDRERNSGSGEGTAEADAPLFTATRRCLGTGDAGRPLFAPFCPCCLRALSGA